MKKIRVAVLYMAVMIVGALALAPRAGVANHYILCDGNKKCALGAQFSSLAYIGNTSSDYVTVIDTTTNTVVSTVNVGQHTTGIAVNAAASRAYAANSQNVVVINMATNEVIANIAYGTIPDMVAGVALNPAGTRLYVTDQQRAGIAVIDTATNTVITNVTTGYHAFRIAVSPDGRRVYATSFYDDMVSVIDALTDSVVANIPIDNPFFSPPIAAGDFSAGPSGVVVNPAGTRVYVANAFLNDPSLSHVYVTVIDATTNTIIANVPTGPSRSLDIAMDPAGTRVYTSNGAVIDTATNTVVGAIPASSYGLAVDPTGTKIYALQAVPPMVLVVDAESKAAVATIPLDETPFAVGQFISGP